MIGTCTVCKGIKGRGRGGLGDGERVEYVRQRDPFMVVISCSIPPIDVFGS
jgi:hypothetical protein